MTDRRTSAGTDLREPDTRAVRGSMTVAELTHFELDEDQDPRFGSRDHDHRGSRDAQAFDDRWTRDVPRPSAPGRGSFRDVAEATADRRRYEEVGYGADRYDTGPNGEPGRGLNGRYEDARYVRDTLDAGRGGGFRNGTGRFDADVLGWGRTSAYGSGSDDVRSDDVRSDDVRSDDVSSDDGGSDVHDLHDHGATRRNGAGRYGVDALDPGWRAPSPDGSERSGRDALDTGDLGRYGSDPYLDELYADGARDGGYRNGSGRSWPPLNGHPGREDAGGYDFDRHESGRDDLDRYDSGPYGSDRYEPDSRDTGRNGRVRHDSTPYDSTPYDSTRYESGRFDPTRYAEYEPDGDPYPGGRSGADDRRYRNGSSRNGNGRAVRNDLDVDRGEAARLDDAPYDAADGRAARYGAGRVDRAPYSRPRRVADGYEPEDEYPVHGRTRHEESADLRAGVPYADLEETYDGRRNGRRRGDAYDDSYDGAYDDGHVVDDYGTDPGGHTVGTGRAARRRAREREEDGRGETRQFDLATDEEPDVDPESEPAPADGAVEDDGTGTKRKKRRRWPWVVGGVAVAGGLAVPVVLAMQDGTQSQRVSATSDSAGFGTGPAAPVDGNPDAPAAGQVVYQLTGSGTASSVTYGRGSSISQVSGAQLPWEQTMPGVNGGSEYTLTATAAEGADEISCRISVDGAVIAEQKAEGDYAAVSCTGRR